MTTIDFSPLFRSAIGFDRLAKSLESAYHAEAGGYPPYNIEVTGEDQYRITMAVAGFKESELELEVKDNVLRVAGGHSEDTSDRRFLHRGIAHRNFERSFQLADYVQVKGAQMKDGLLHIELLREVPEAMKPRRIEIGSSEDRLIEGKADQAAA